MSSLCFTRIFLNTLKFNIFLLGVKFLVLIRSIFHLTNIYRSGEESGSIRLITSWLHVYMKTNAKYSTNNNLTTPSCFRYIFIFMPHCCGTFWCIFHLNRQKWLLFYSVLIPYSITWFLAFYRISWHLKDNKVKDKELRKLKCIGVLKI